MRERIDFLYHHGSLIGAMDYFARMPYIAIGKPFKKGDTLTPEQAVEAYMSKVFDFDSHYHTADPQSRSRLKVALVKALRISCDDKHFEITYLPDQYFAGDLICHACHQFIPENYDPDFCPRRNN
jgi:hypothetical protein